jgi:hypothetical protein
MFCVSMLKYYGASGQDFFVMSMLKNKKDCYFLELGSNHPIDNNNTYLLETQFNWNGIMIEYSKEFLNLYQQYRSRSNYLITDATTINFNELFNKYNCPKNIDYLQIDLEANNGSTITALENISKVMNEYKFATITFEHDAYQDFTYQTRKKSRDIFEKFGYVRVFSDVYVHGYPQNPYEDWYVHPELVDMELVKKLKTDDYLSDKQIIERLSKVIK